MADDTIRLEVEAESAGNEDEVARQLARAIENALSKAGREVANEFRSLFRSIGKFGSQSLDQTLGKGSQGLRRTTEAAERLERQLQGVRQTGEGVEKVFADLIDPSTFRGAQEGIERLVELLARLENEGADLEGLDLQRLRLGIEGTRAELTTLRTAFQQTTLAVRESEQAQARASNQASRERIATQQAEKARFVAITQANAARELAEIRASSAQQVAATQAAARRRVAAFELASRSIRSLERGLRSVFDNTARVAGAAFRGLGRTVSNSTTTIRRAFSNTSNSIRSSNRAIANDYRSTWRSNTSTVTNNLRTQGDRIRDFSREATQEISTIGVGALGGFALLGVGIGRALRGGFERAATLEDSQRALTTLLGNAAAAQQLQAEVLDIVTGTPFKLDQFANAATQLVAFNVEAQKVPEYLNAIANAAAVRGGESGQTIDSLVRVFGQISTAGRVTGEDLNQLSEAGVPALQILGNAFGETSGDMRDLISEGAVPAQQALDALTKGIVEGSDGVNGATAAFGGLAKELGQSLRGSIGNASAALDRLGAGIIQTFQPQIIGLVQGITAGLDILGDAFKSLAQAVVDNPFLGVFLDRLRGLSGTLKGARDSLQPIFTVLAEGAVNFGLALGALGVVRRLPRLFGLLGFALRRLLTPMNLLLTAGFAVSTFLTQLLQDSPELRAALDSVGEALGAVFAPIGQLVTTVLPEISQGISAVLTPLLEGLSDAIIRFAVPALESFANFLTGTLLPGVERFASFVGNTLIPIVTDGSRALGERLGAAFIELRDFIFREFPAIEGVVTTVIDGIQTAFRGVANFVRDEVVPVVGPILSRAVDIGVSAFRGLYNFVTQTLLPVLRDDLGPVLAGLTIGAGFLATGNVPVAAFAGLAGVAVAAFRNDDIRNAIVEQVRAGVDAAKGLISDLVDDGVLRTIGTRILEGLRFVGRQLGNILTDPTTFGTVAAIGAAAALAAGSFVRGFIEGVVSNIPEYVDIISDALSNLLQSAISSLASDPLLVGGILAAFTGGVALARFLRTGREIGTSLSRGIQQGLDPSQQVGAGGPRGFLQGLFGNDAAVRSAAATQAGRVNQAFNQELQRLSRTSQALGGPRLDFVGPVQARDLQNARREVDTLVGSIGRARAGGILLRDGLSQVGEGIVRRAVPQVRQGMRTIGEAIRLGGRAAIQGAGIALGGIFAAAFAGQLAADRESSPIQRALGGIGLLGAGATVGALTTPGLGVAVAGLGAVTGVLADQEAQAQRTKAQINEYTEAVIRAGEAGNNFAILDQFFSNLQTAGLAVNEQLREAGFNAQEFVDAVRSGDTATIDRILASVGGVRGEIFGASEAAIFLNQQLGLLGEGDQLARVNVDLRRIAEGAGDAGAAGARVAEEVLRIAEAQGVADVATEAFQTKLQELNQERLGALREQVQSVKSELDTAKTAADKAREAVRAYLTGDQVQTSTDQAILQVSRAAQQVNTDLAGVGNQLLTAGATLGAQVRTSVEEARGTAIEIISDRDILTREDAAAALEPLRAAADEQGGLAADAINQAFDELLADFETPEFLDLSEAVTGADELVSTLQGELEAATADLSFAEALPEGFFDADVEAARAAFDEAGAAAVQGFTEGLAADSEATAQATALAENALASARAALGISSPSTVFAGIGQDSAAGFAQGIIAGVGTARAAAVSLGAQAASAISVSGVASQFRSAGAFASEGFASGIRAGAGSAYAAARSIAAGVTATIRAALAITSPSKVTRALGVDTSLGFAQGITAGASASAKAARLLAENTATAFRTGFRPIGRAIGKGISQGIADSRSDVIGEISSIITQAETGAIRPDQARRITLAAAASSLFARTIPGRLPGLPNRLDVERSRLDVSETFRDLRGSFESLQGEFRQARQARREGEPLSARDRALLSQGGLRSLGLGTAAGQTNRRAFLDAGERIRNFGDTLLQAGTPIKQVVQEIKDYRNGLIRQGKSLGFNTKQMDNLLRVLGLTNEQLAQFTREVNDATKAANRRSKPTPDETDSTGSGTADRPDPVSGPAPIIGTFVYQGTLTDPEAAAVVAANRLAAQIVP